ncbi:SDR family oxidoreductase [Emcibacter sp. SYSU 3D8]|uniref:SDR family oxidoreductase n=1 Tax=Emcibacter sp. SYSU 3D8 TaxID=3133969 RepID=UPI0031FEC9BE
MKITVIGGTGLIGSKVVEMLTGKGHAARAAAPETGVNTVTREGLTEALAGADVVIDVANSPSFEDKAAMDFFQTAGRNLADAEAAAGVRHHVALSVVGTERLQGSGYFRAKLAQESLIRASVIPYTIVHATQFFEFIRGIAQSGTVGSSVRLPHARFQPMAARDVAAAVVDAALGTPVNGVVEIAGPEMFYLDELTGRVLAFDRDPRNVIADPEARYFGLKLDDMSLMPSPNAAIGATSFDWWLTHVAPPKATAPAPRSAA